MDLYRALRGVCIGPEKHLMPTDAPVELDAGTARFLVGIGAVELVPSAAPAPADPPSEPAATPPSATVTTPAAHPVQSPAVPTPAASEPVPAKPGSKKEK